MPALCILVAEDNPVDRLILATLLERQGHRVLTAGDGAQAVARFAESRPHLVLMDMLMPVMDGLGLLDDQALVLAGDQVALLEYRRLQQAQAVHRQDLGFQYEGVVGLGEEVVAAGLEAADQRLALGHRGQEDDRD